MVKVVKKITRGDITRVILQLVKASGVLSVALLTPRVLSALVDIGVVDLKNKGVISNARARLLKNGFLVKSTDGYLCISKKGEERLNALELNNYQLIIPRTWDKKWRVLIFDIPEKKRNIRDKVRNTLNAMGFARLQDSVWVFPYDCAEIISLIKVDLRIGKDLLYMVVDHIENDKYLKENFDLY